VTGEVTKVALVAYPLLEEADRQWIESIRGRHDPQASRIAAHFTLVFPVEVALEAVVEHTSARLMDARVIPFVLRRAEALPDRLAGGCHVFLVPEEGRDEIVALHDRLYEGVLLPYLRDDMPFVPHITVGGCSDLGECERLAEALNRGDRAVRGTVMSIDLIEVGNENVKTLIRVPLEDRTPPNSEMQRTRHG
jgi:2'-5' RNA ligase